jgi:hypothetical protein
VQQRAGSDCVAVSGSVLQEFAFVPIRVVRKNVSNSNIVNSVPMDFALQGRLINFRLVVVLGSEHIP